MLHFSNLALFASVVTCGILITQGTYYPNVYYVNGRCGQSIHVQGDARIQLANTTYLPAATECFIEFVPNSSQQLTAKFVSYYMNPAYVDEYGYCPYESIQLYDEKGGILLSSYNDYCSKVRPPANIFLGKSGQLYYTTGNYSDIVTPGVDLLLTEVTLKSQTLNYQRYPTCGRTAACARGISYVCWSRGEEQLNIQSYDNRLERRLRTTCPSSDFDCGNGYCIFKDLTCNGYDDCGNNLDESGDGCSVSHSPSEGVIAGIIIGIVLALVFVTVIEILIGKHRLRRSYTQRF